MEDCDSVLEWEVEGSIVWCRARLRQKGMHLGWMEKTDCLLKSLTCRSPHSVSSLFTNTLTHPIFTQTRRLFKVTPGKMLIGVHLFILTLLSAVLVRTLLLLCDIDCAHASHFNRKYSRLGAKNFTQRFYSCSRGKKADWFWKVAFKLFNASINYYKMKTAAKFQLFAILAKKIGSQFYIKCF